MARHWLPLCALPALSSFLLASDGKAPGASAEPGTPAAFSWGDADGDGRLDLAALSGEGTLQLLANAGEGRFEDVSERVGLAGIRNAALALWVDYDSDGRQDLFVGAREGASRLFHNEGGVFTDMTAASGLASAGSVLSAGRRLRHRRGRSRRRPYPHVSAAGSPGRACGRCARRPPSSSSATRRASPSPSSTTC